MSGERRTYIAISFLCCALIAAPLVYFVSDSSKSVVNDAHTLITDSAASYGRELRNDGAQLMPLARALGSLPKLGAEIEAVETLMQGGVSDSDAELTAARDQLRLVLSRFDSLFSKTTTISLVGKSGVVVHSNADFLPIATQLVSEKGQAAKTDSKGMNFGNADEMPKTPLPLTEKALRGDEELTTFIHKGNSDRHRGGRGRCNASPLGRMNCSLSPSRFTVQPSSCTKP